MAFDLDLQREFLGYTAVFSRPALELWGSGGKIAKGFYDALSNRGVTLQNMQVTARPASAGDSVFTVRIGTTGVVKFSFDKLEFTFENFTEDFLQSMPAILEDSTQWIRDVVPSFKFATHVFNYFTHANIKGSTVQEFLKTLNAKSLQAAGTSLGTGAIFNHTVPERNWVTQVIIDRSQSLAGALFVGFVLSVSAERVDYANMLPSSRKYLGALLGELGLNVPEIPQ